jgi:hypothetical protein
LAAAAKKLDAGCSEWRDRLERITTDELILIVAATKDAGWRDHLGRIMEGRQRQQQNWIQVAWIRGTDWESWKDLNLLR